MLSDYPSRGGEGSALVCQAVPWERPMVRNEVWGVHGGPRLIIGVNFLVGPVPPLEAGWPRLSLLPGRPPCSLHINIRHHALCRKCWLEVPSGHRTAMCMTGKSPRTLLGASILWSACRSQSKQSAEMYTFFLAGSRPCWSASGV